MVDKSIHTNARLTNVDMYCGYLREYPCSWEAYTEALRGKGHNACNLSSKSTKIHLNVRIIYRHIYIYHKIFYFLPCWVFVPTSRLSLFAASGGNSLITVPRLFTEMTSLVAEHGLHSCGAWA